MRLDKKGISHFLELLWAFTAKEIKVRYKSAVLGFLWMFLNPILQMFVIGFVFSLIFRFGIKDYSLFLFTGLLPWNFFSLSLSTTSTSIVTNREIITKSKFPYLVIPLSQILASFFHFLISIFILIALLIFLGKGSIAFLFLPLLFSWQIILVVGIALWASSLYVFFRDVAFLVQSGLMVLFYALPIIYPLSMIPDKWLFIFYLNPLVGVISTYHSILANYPLLPLPILGFQILASLVIFLSGYLFFRKKCVSFADWL